MPVQQKLNFARDNEGIEISFGNQILHKLRGLQFQQKILVRDWSGLNSPFLSKSLILCEENFQEFNKDDFT